MKFEMKKRDAAARLCQLSTAHGTITTPTLLPVINPNKMIISPKEMKQLFGTEMIITNSYIIRKNEKLGRIALEKGVHHLVDFDGPIMTDSGTFQSYMYGDIDVDPLEIICFQRDIGSDIGTILDIFGTPDQDKKQAESGVSETVKRAKMSIPYKGKMNIACPVQGGIFPFLRTNCAQQLSKLDADFYPIGGVVPLMEDQRYTELVEIIIASKKGLSAGKPVHLFGAGHPLVFSLAVALGCDVFDSSAYIKYAQQDRIILPWGTVKLFEIDELGCNCPVCSSYSAEELRKCEKQDRLKLLAKHNLFVSTAEIKRIRNAISEGSLWELVEQKARLHPSLLDAVRRLRKTDHKKWLELFEPVYKKKALFYTGDHTVHRPFIHRLHQRLIRIVRDSAQHIVVLPERKKPYQQSYAEVLESLMCEYKDSDIFVDTPLGPVPLWLDEMYPFAQSVFPEEIDNETERYVNSLFEHELQTKDMVYWNEDAAVNIETKDSSIFSDDIFDRKRLKYIGSMQFGSYVSKILFEDDLICKKSKKTGKIRNVYSGKNHIVSLRASDGMFTLKKKGAEMIHQRIAAPSLRVMVEDDAIPFVLEGKSVFAKFVKDADSCLRPYDECLIVDSEDELLAVGRCLLNYYEMKEFSYGVAVKNREVCRDE